MNRNSTLGKRLTAIETKQGGELKRGMITVHSDDRNTKEQEDQAIAEALKDYPGKRTDYDFIILRVYYGKPNPDNPKPLKPITVDVNLWEKRRPSSFVNNRAT